MKFNDMLRELPKLSQEELATVRAAIDHLLGSSDHLLDNTSALYGAMITLLGIKLAYRDFNATKPYREWRKSAPAVVYFIDQTFPASGKISKMAITKYLLTALIDDLKARKVPVTLGVVVSNISRLPQIFDACFPNYRESGMAHLVLKALERK